MKQFCADDLVEAKEEEATQILQFYQAFIGKEGCSWNEKYPTMEEVSKDLQTNSLFVIKDEKGIAAAASIDDDPNVDNLEIWTIPHAREIARLGVREDYQNNGLGRAILQMMMDKLKQRGYDGVHFLVSQKNEAALRCYHKLDFQNLGTLRLYDHDWFCYEKAL